MSPSVVDTPSVTYPSNPLIAVYDKLASHSLIAYKDVATGQAHTLALGATEDITLTSSGDVQLYGGADHDHMMTVSLSPLGETVINTKSTDLRLTTDDPLLHKLHVGAVTIRENDSVAILETSKPDGIYLNNNITVDGNAEFNQSASFQGSVFCKDKHYAQNYNLYKAFNPLDHPTSATLTGYAFTINTNDQLELLRYNRFYNGSNVVTRVAVFGSGRLTTDDPSDYQYVAFDELSGLSIVQGSNTYPIPSSGGTEDISNADLLALRNSHLALSNAHDVTAASLSTLTTRFTALSNSTVQLSSQQQQHGTTLTSHSTLLNALETATATTSSDLSDLTIHVLDLKTASNQFSTQLINTQQSTTQQFGQVSTSITVLSASNQTLSNHVSDLFQSDIQIGSRIATTELNLANLQNDLSQLQTNITGDVNTSLATLEDSIDAVDATLAALSNYTTHVIVPTLLVEQASSNMSFTTALDTLTGDLSTLSDAHGALLADFTSHTGFIMDAYIPQIAVALDEITSSNAAQQDLIDLNTASNAIQQDLIDDLQTLTSTHSADIADLQTLTEAHTLSNATLSNDLSLLTNAHIGLSGSFASLASTTSTFLSSTFPDHLTEFASLSNATQTFSNAVTAHIATLPDTRLIQTPDKVSVIYAAPEPATPAASQLAVDADVSSFYRVTDPGSSFESVKVAHASDGTVLTLITAAQSASVLNTTLSSAPPAAAAHQIFKTSAASSAPSVIWAISDILYDHASVLDRFEPMVIAPTSDGGLLVACELETSLSTYSSIQLNNASAPLSPTSAPIDASSPNTTVALLIKYSSLGDVAWVATVNNKTALPTGLVQLAAGGGSSSSDIILAAALEFGSPVVTDAQGTATELSSVPAAANCIAFLKFTAAGQFLSMAHITCPMADPYSLAPADLSRNSLHQLPSGSFVAVNQSRRSSANTSLLQVNLTDSNGFTIPSLAKSTDASNLISIIRLSPVLTMDYIATLEVHNDATHRTIDAITHSMNDEITIALTTTDTSQTIYFNGFNTTSSVPIPSLTGTADVLIHILSGGDLRWNGALSAQQLQQTQHNNTKLASISSSHSLLYITQSSIVQLSLADGATLSISPITGLEESMTLLYPSFFSRGPSSSSANFFLAAPTPPPTPAPVFIFQNDNYAFSAKHGIVLLSLAAAVTPSPYTMIVKGDVLATTLTGSLHASNIVDASIATVKLAPQAITLPKLHPDLSLGTALLGNKQAVFAAQPDQTFNSATLPDASMILWDTLAVPPYTPLSMSGDGYKFVALKEGYFIVHITTATSMLWRLKVFSATDQLIASYFVQGQTPQWIYLRSDQYFQIHYNDVNTLTIDYATILSITHLPVLAFQSSSDTPETAFVHYDASRTAELLNISTSAGTGDIRDINSSVTVRRIPNLGTLSQSAAGFLSTPIASYDASTSIAFPLGLATALSVPAHIPFQSQTGTTILLVAALDPASLAAGENVLQFQNANDPVPTILTLAHDATAPTTAVVTLANANAQIMEVSVRDFFPSTKSMSVYAFCIEATGIRVYRDGTSLYENFYPGSATFSDRLSTSSRFISTSATTDLAELMIFAGTPPSTDLAALSSKITAKWAPLWQAPPPFRMLRGKADSVFFLEGVRLWMWGKSIDEQQTLLSPTEITHDGSLSERVIAQIDSCGISGFVAIDSGGRLHTAGKLYSAVANIIIGDDVTMLAKDWSTHENLQGKTIVAASGSPFSLYALDSEGSIYAMGYDTSIGFAIATDTDLNVIGNIVNVPTSIMMCGALVEKTIVKVCNCWKVAFALDSMGVWYVWGVGLYYMLGDGTHRHIYLAPQEATFGGSLTGRSDIIDIVGNDNDGAYAITSDGRVHTWGGQDLQFTIPTVILGSLSDRTIVSVSSGWNSVIALDSTGDVHAWKYVPDNSGDLIWALDPINIMNIGSLAGKKAVAITCTWAPSMHVVDTDGNIHSWGYELYGSFGNGNGTEDVSSIPIQIGIPRAMAQGERKLLSAVPIITGRLTRP